MDVVITQATGSVADQTIPALQSAGREPEQEAQSREIQVPEALATSSGAGAKGMGWNPIHGRALGRANPSSEQDGEAPRGGMEGGTPPSGLGMDGMEPRQAGLSGTGLDGAGLSGVKPGQVGTGHGQVRELLHGATPSEQTSPGVILPASGILIPAQPTQLASSDSDSTAEFARIGARPKAHTVLQTHPETESLLQA